jgi:hypothetical protein
MTLEECLAVAREIAPEPRPGLWWTIREEARQKRFAEAKRLTEALRYKKRVAEHKRLAAIIATAIIPLWVRNRDCGWARCLQPRRGGRTGTGPPKTRLLTKLDELSFDGRVFDAAKPRRGGLARQ